MESESDVKVKSLYKAIRVLECFTTKEPELGITQISEKLGIYKSTVHNILTTFEKAGYIEKNPENNKYRLGVKILELAYIINSQISIRKVIVPHLQDLADQSGETVYFGIPNNGDVLYLDSAYPHNAIDMRSILGEIAPMYCTAIGKAMLACYTDEDILKLIPEKMERFTENTIIEPRALLNEIKKIRETGYAIDNMEHEYGIRCVGMAVKNRSRQLVAGISVSGPSLRFDGNRTDKIIELIRTNIAKIQERL